MSSSQDNDLMEITYHDPKNDNNTSTEMADFNTDNSFLDDQNDQTSLLDDKVFGDAAAQTLAGSTSSSGVSDLLNPNASLWSIEYYQRYFQVTTTQVFQRLIRSLQPVGHNFFFSDEDPRPDLYGPFWIATTLIFLMGASGNFADYLFNYLSQQDDPWKYDFTKVTTAATVLYSLISIIPVAFYFALQRVGRPIALITIVSIYGYSLFIFVITSLLCIIPIEFFRWFFVILSVVISARFIIRNLVPPMLDRKGEQLSQDVLIISAISIVHAGFGFVLKLYFFHYPL